MALETGLNLSLQQRLTMTPRLQQSIQMLQMTVAELTQLIEQEMLANPTLELERDTPPEPEPAPVEEGAAPAPGSTDEGERPAAAAPEAGRDGPADGVDSVDDGERAALEADPAETADGERALEEFDWEEYFRDDDDSRGEEDPAFREEREEGNFENVVTRGASLHDHLIMQLRLAPLSEEEYRIGEFLVGNIDPAGYLTISNADAARFLGCAPADVERVVAQLQGFEPLGVAARTPRECLLLQYRASDDYEPGDLVERLLDRHLDALSEKQFKPIAKELDVTPAQVQGALDWISANLDPKPGLKYSSDPAGSYITPDVVVEKIGDDYVVQLNDAGIPRLRISNRYKSLARDRAGTPAETRRFIRDRLEAASWLIKSIQQRRETIFKVASAIVRFQRDFLDHGISRFRPLTMREVADEIGMHEATVSRVTTGKHMQTPRGVYEFKYFFTSGLSAAPAADGSGGGAVSSLAVKERIKALVAGEDPKKPLSDQHIAETLKKEGIEIARRTVAKYREELGIDSSAKRKRYD